MSEDYHYSRKVKMLFDGGGETVCQFWNKHEEDFKDPDRHGEFLALAANNHTPLLDALRKFGRHSDKCNFYVYEVGIAKTVADCDCGLVAVLNTATGTE